MKNAKLTEQVSDELKEYIESNQNVNWLEILNHLTIKFVSCDRSDFINIYNKFVFGGNFTEDAE